MSALPGGLCECYACLGGGTEPGTYDDDCRVCRGEGVLPVDEGATCVPPEAAAPPPRDEDAPWYDDLADAWVHERTRRVVETAFRGRAA